MTVLAALALAASLAALPRVAVMPVASGEGVPGRTADAVTEAITAQVRRYAGAEVVTQKEILSVLSLEQQKQMLGCQTDSCMAELGGALGVARMVTGDLAHLGESWLVHLKLVDAVKVKVLAQSDRRRRRGSIDDVLDVLPAMVAELFPAGGGAPPLAPVVAAPGALAAPASQPQGGLARTPPAPEAAPEATEAALRVPSGAGPPLASAIQPLPPPTAPMPAPEAARRVLRPWAEASIPVPLPERRDLAVYTDDRGRYLATAPFEAGARRVFAGTADKLFLQEVLVAGAAGTTAHGFAFWDPRARSPAEAFFEAHAGKARLVCGAHEVPLRLLSRAEADALLRATTFYAPRWRREPHLLAQDDEGNWFYVDRARAGAGAAPGGPDYRLYAGPLGKLSRLEIADVADGPDGLVLVTASGKLRLGRAADGTPVVDWLAGGGRRMLRALDPVRNGAVVYRQLGVYEAARFGTPCDGVVE